MNAFAPDTRDAVARLEAALNAPAMPPREAESCARLLDKLTRPVRVGVFGLSTGGDDWLLRQIIGAEILPQGADWPTLEIAFGTAHATLATFEDGMTSKVDGAADPGLLSQAPVFLRIEAPIDMLLRMSFLYLATDDAPAEQLSALDWAEPRTDIAIWATTVFGQEEVRIWAQAPDRLKNHALLVCTDPAQAEADLAARAGFDFDGVYAVPRQSEARGSVDRLMQRLDADINEARAADLDAADLFLHRLGHLVPSHVPSSATASARDIAAEAAIVPPGTTAEPVAIAAKTDAPIAQPKETLAISSEAQALLSEPILYLKRRARALLELIEWKAADADMTDDAWAEEVLTHACETTEGLQSRAMDWPEDDTRALTLRRTLDEACDVAVLLQVEGGPDQAQDAAMMLLQLRGDFERQLAA
ncbi:MAG: hypothetical protein AAF689_14630 [Pseudomonadota bacterium]